MTSPQKGINDGLRSTFAQLLGSLAFSSLCCSVGLSLAMPTIVIGALRSEDSPLTLTEDQASWFGSLVYIVQPVASVLSAFPQDRLGRKKCLILINIPMFLGWCTLYYATSTTHLFISAALMGISIGFMEAPILSYIGEISQPRLRGVFSCFGPMFYNLGLMIESFLGAAVPWRTMVLLSTAGPIIGVLAMFLVPESPAWLVSKGRVDDAEKSFQWLRGWVGPENVKEELNALVTYVKETQSVKATNMTEYTLVTTDECVIPEAKNKNMWQVVQEPEVLLAFRIIFIYFIVSTCASLTAIRPFFIEILSDLNLPVKPHMVVAVCGGLQMLGAISMTVGVKTLGKRGLTFVSLGISVLCCLGLAAYLMLGWSMPWLPLVFFWLSYYCGSLGILPLPWVLITEIFPLRARAIGGGVSGAFGYVIMFITIKTYYSLASLVGVSGVCLVYGIVGLLGFIYLYYDMVETEGISLETIERKLTERRSTRKKQSVTNGDVKIKGDINA